MLFFQGSEMTMRNNATPANASREKESRVFVYCATEGEWHTNKK
jgi:hypothetical protein